jgi:hypothetical protein
MGISLSHNVDDPCGEITVTDCSQEKYLGLIFWGNVLLENRQPLLFIEHPFFCESGARMSNGNSMGEDSGLPQGPESLPNQGTAHFNGGRLRSEQSPYGIVPPIGS